MENGQQPIYPDPMRGVEQSFTNQSPHELPMGLTKREYFAGLAMQSLAAAEPKWGTKDIARFAIKISDDLLKELEKQKNEAQ